MEVWWMQQVELEMTTVRKQLPMVTIEYSLCFIEELTSIHAFSKQVDESHMHTVYLGFYC